MGVERWRLVSWEKLTNGRSGEAESLVYLSKTPQRALFQPMPDAQTRQLEIVSFTKNSRNQRSQGL